MNEYMILTVGQGCDILVCPLSTKTLNLRGRDFLDPDFGFFIENHNLFFPKHLVACTLVIEEKMF